MKRYTSRFLKTVAILYMAFPASYLVFTALLFNIPAAQCFRILISPSYFFLSVLAIVSGFGLWEMRRWSWYVFLASNILAGYANAVLLTDYGETSHNILAFIVSIAILFAITRRVSREVRVPYFLPRIRWWESNPRYRLIVPVQVKRKDGEALEGEILDLSLGGCFIKLRADLRQDEAISLSFSIFGQPMSCEGTVVWRTQSTVTHPRGVGVKFAALGRPQRSTLRAATRRLKQISALYRSSRYLMNQDEFHKRMGQLQDEKLELPVSRRTRAAKERPQEPRA